MRVAPIIKQWGVDKGVKADLHFMGKVMEKWRGWLEYKAGLARKFIRVARVN